MARLTAAQRNALPNSDFAGPNRTFPVEDKSHQIAAERLVGRSKAAGNISASTAGRIKSKAAARMGNKKPGGFASTLGKNLAGAY